MTKIVTNAADDGPLGFVTDLNAGVVARRWFCFGLMLLVHYRRSRNVPLGNVRFRSECGRVPARATSWIRSPYVCLECESRRDGGRPPVALTDASNLHRRAKSENVPFCVAPNAATPQIPRQRSPKKPSRTSKCYKAVSGQGFGTVPSTPNTP